MVADVHKLVLYNLMNIIIKGSKPLRLAALG